MLRRTRFLSLLALLSLGACAVDTDTVTPPASEGGARADGVAKALKVVRSLPADRDGFEIREARVEGSQLIVDVGYSGGCEDHEFDLYWNGQIRESDPGQADLRLIHNGNGDFCESLRFETLSFDIAALGDGPLTISLDGGGNNVAVEIGEGEAGAENAVKVVPTLPADRDGFEIREARVEGSQLIVDVGYSGGCEDHEFDLYWNGQIRESDPGQADLRLIHNGNGDFCESLRFETLSFDISALGGGPLTISLDGGGNNVAVEVGEGEAGANDFVKVLPVLPAERDGFDLRDARIEGSRLIVDVGYSGGCEDHEFELYWNGQFLGGHFLQTELLLIHNANGDFCEALRSETLSFDIEALGSGQKIIYLKGGGSRVLVRVPPPRG